MNTPAQLQTAAPPWQGALLPLQQEEGTYVRLPGSLLFVFGACAALTLLTANPLLTAASVAVLPLFMMLLWRVGETPVLLFAVSFQWLQVTIKVFHADMLGVPVNDIGIADDVASAVWLGLAGLVVLAVGMRLGMRWLKGSAREQAANEVAGISVGQVVKLYLVLSFMAVIADFMGNVFGGLRQPADAVAGIRWIAFFTLGYVTLKRRKSVSVFALIVLYEIITGIGFFSGFKTAIFVALIIFFTVYYRLHVGNIVIGLILLVLLLVMGSAWTMVKEQYRSFLNQGSGQQEVVVSQGAQIVRLGQLLSELTADDLVLGLEPLFARIAYVDYFAVTLEYVPAYTPHERGTVWGAAIAHILAPRLLYPDKPILESDSELTMRYTGLVLASGDEGTSISLGYFGESYVDFGRIGMFGPIFIVGLLWGLMYTYFIRKARSALIGFGFATSLLLGAYQFEVASIKLFGGMVVKFVVLAVLLKVGEAWIRRFIQDRRAVPLAPAGADVGLPAPQGSYGLPPYGGPEGYDPRIGPVFR